MTVMLGNEIRRFEARDQPRRKQFYKRPGMREIVVGVNILQQMAAGHITHTAGLPGRIERTGKFVRFGIEFIAIHALVHSYAPQNNAGMASVTRYHFTDIPEAVFPPLPLAEVLPRGHFGEHKQTDLIAAVKEMDRIRIMRRAHKIAAETEFEQLGIRLLCGSGHGGAYIRIALMTVQPDKLYMLTVEHKAPAGELCLTKTETAGKFIRLICYFQRI